MKSKKILVVDDCDINIKLMEAIFDVNEFTLITSKNALEGLDIAKKEHLSLIILDLVMPNVDGFEFLKRIKSNKNTSSIPVVILSALPSQENSDKCIKMGAIDFILKPFIIKDLKNKITEILQSELCS